METDQHASRQVGRLVALWRYPVKAMAGEALERAELSWHGLAGDRRWAFIRDSQVRSGFPWLTIRERSDLVAYEPVFASPEDPDSSPVVVRTPAGEQLEVDDPQLAAQLGDGVRPIKQDRGVFDAMPLSLIGLETLEALGAAAGADLDPRRFRPNLVVDTGPGGAFAEEEWVGQILRVGGARFRVDRRDGRCVVVNVDPDSAERDPRVLRAVARERDACLGVYGSTVQPGLVAVGDAVLLD